jgi:hypothetical protein
MSLMLCSCASLPPEVILASETFKNFMQQHKVKMLPFTIKISNSKPNPSNVIARCSQGEITIYASRFNKLSLSQKKAVVYHELGHCALNLTHRQACQVNSKIKVRSLMRSNIIDFLSPDFDPDSLLIELLNNTPIELGNKYIRCFPKETIDNKEMW